MKKLIALILSTVVGIMLIPFTAQAAAPIDTSRPCSLTLQYRHGETYFEGLEIRTYRIAQVHANGTYTLTNGFEKYPVKIYDVTSQAEWRHIASTLAAYAEADGLVPTHTATTDFSGAVAFTDILPGMYLTLSVAHQSDGLSAVFESFLSVVPYPMDDGGHVYDVTAYPKCETSVLEEVERDREMRVIIEWKDSGYTDKRPKSVEVEIYRNGSLYLVRQCSAEGNWTFSWTAPNDGSLWSAAERGLPEGYTVTITEYSDTIVITNHYEADTPEAPPTGDITVMWPCLLIMCLSGCLLLIIATWQKRRDV